MVTLLDILHAPPKKKLAPLFGIMFVLKKWVIGNDVTFEEVHALSKILGCFRKR